jgi:hypothetical protein
VQQATAKQNAVNVQQRYKASRKQTADSAATDNTQHVDGLLAAAACPIRIANAY